MTREIKFRAWDGETMGEAKYMRLPAQSDEFVKIMQYTGLTDRNGKGIYEGDIVWESVDTWGVVKFDDNACFSLFMHNVGPNESLADFISDSKVIGNIYENPELIGGAENE